MTGTSVLSSPRRSSSVSTTASSLKIASIGVSKIASIGVSMPVAAAPPTPAAATDAPMKILPSAVPAKAEMDANTGCLLVGVGSTRTSTTGTAAVSAVAETGSAPRTMNSFSSPLAVGCSTAANEERRSSKAAPSSGSLGAKPEMIASASSSENSWVVMSSPETSSSVMRRPPRRKSFAGVARVLSLGAASLR